MNPTTVHQRTEEVDERLGSRAHASEAASDPGRGGVRRPAKPTDGVGATVRLTRPLSSYAGARNRRLGTAAGGSE